MAFLVSSVAAVVTTAVAAAVTSAVMTCLPSICFSAISERASTGIEAAEEKAKRQAVLVMIEKRMLVRKGERVEFGEVL